MAKKKNIQIFLEVLCTYGDFFKSNSYANCFIQAATWRLRFINSISRSLLLISSVNPSRPLHLKIYIKIKINLNFSHFFAVPRKVL